MERIVVLPDVHLTTKPSSTYQVVKKFIKYQRPNKIIILGDFLDMKSLSHWMENKREEMEGVRFKEEMDCANKELDFLQANSCKVIYLEGNHEWWVKDYINKFPSLRGILDLDLQLDLNGRGVPFIPMNDLYEVGDDAKVYFTHGLYTNKYHACKHIQNIGANIIYGHTHGAQTYLLNMKKQEPYMAYGLGWLGDERDCAYLKNRPTNWIHQFAVVEMDKTLFNVTPINIINDRFYYAGRLYK